MNTQQSVKTKESTRLSKNLVVGLKQILVPYDFSERALKALEYATSFAKLSGGKITLVNVIEPPVVAPSAGYPIVSFPYDGLVDNSIKELKSIARKHVPEGIPVDAKVLLGQPFREIVALAGKLSAGLIVVTTHGYTGMKHVLLGSTAERIVRYAPCPVLVVRVQDFDFNLTAESRTS